MKVSGVKPACMWVAPRWGPAWLTLAAPLALVINNISTRTLQAGALNNDRLCSNEDKVGTPKSGGLSGFAEITKIKSKLDWGLDLNLISCKCSSLELTTLVLN